MLQKTLTRVFGSKHEHDLKSMLPLLGRINELEGWAMGLSEEDFKTLTGDFKERLSKGESIDDILPEAYAMTREAARRVLGERPYDVQLLGSIVLHRGKIMEMKTGEGKTLSRRLGGIPERPDRQGGPHHHRERLPGRARRRLDGTGL